MSGFIPHTPNEVAEMLTFLGIESVDQLFETIPSAIRLSRDSLKLPDSKSEFDVLEELETLAAKNRALGPDFISFAGGGAYDHDIASAIKSLSTRSEFLTAYTPYQPEVAQGVLQALFEYQSLVSRLSGLEISNASLYDGASALVEAINLTVAQSKNGLVWISQGINPAYRQVVNTFANGTGHSIQEIPIRNGSTSWPVENPTLPGTIVIGYPNYLGLLEPMEQIISFAQANDIKLIFAYDPVSMALLRSPGELGADVAIAEGQSFGVGLNFGGPYVGLFSTREKYVRHLPGRLVGETVDSAGQTGYVTTLRTREQDIRREKASSNVCTNQTLIAITTAISMSWLGKSGIQELANRCYSGAEYLKDLLVRIDGVELYSSLPSVREFAVKTKMSSELLVDRMIKEGFLAGVPILEGFESSDVYGSLLVTVTEKRTRAQIDHYASTLERIIR